MGDPPIQAAPGARLTVSVQEAATALGISRASAYKAVARGEVPCVRIGRRIVVPIVGLEQMLEHAGRVDRTDQPGASTGRFRGSRARGRGPEGMERTVERAER
ncbi:MAG: helix-turn-helix domain-containing protein [Acidimicrobiales bacterium]